MKKHRYDYILSILSKNKIEVRKKTIVDCGCGDGKGSLCLKKAGAVIVAIDFAEKEVKRCLAAGIKNVKQGDIRNLSFFDNYCDLFFCSETLEHLGSQDCPKAAFEIQRVTKPDGIICITVPKDKGVCFGSALHKTWVQLSDIEKWFDQCKIIFIGKFVKNPKKPNRSNLVVILKLELS